MTLKEVIRSASVFNYCIGDGIFVSYAIFSA